MVIETVQFSFPIDFLQSLTRQTISNVRYFTASGSGKGGLNSSGDRTNYQITFDCQNDFANFHVAGNFSHKEKSVRFSFYEWSENGDLSANFVKDKILKSQKSEDASKSIIKTRSQKREYVRAITEEGSFSPRSKVKKTTSQAKSNNSLTDKQTSQSQISTYLRSNNKVSKDKNSLDLRGSGRNWSSPGEEREEPNEDLFHPRDQEDSENENTSKPHCFAENFPNFHRMKMKKILPKPGKLKPVLKPFLSNEPFQSCRRMIFSSNEKGEIENSTFNKPSMFPLLESIGTMKLTVEEKQGCGKPSQYCLVSSAENDKKAVPVYFYTNISKGVEADPGNLPEEFEIIPVSDGVAIPIVINVRKYESHRKHFRSSLSKKLENIQAIENIQAMGGLMTTMKSDDSRNISNKDDTLSKKLRSLQNRIALESKPKKMDSSGKTCPLMGKLTLEEADHSESSSSDSEMDYEDEMDLIRIPELSALYPSTFIHKKSYDSLKVGKEIALLNFVISSTDLLRSPKNTYYIQGVKDGIEGIVLLGPFVMSHNPQAHLSFMRQPQCLRRIPEAIYKRRRDRWLRKHDKKQFERSLTGVEGDSLVAFVDHDYLTQRGDTAAEESNSHQRETTQNEQLETEDVVITSTWGIQNEADASENEAEEEQRVLSSAMEESQIPLISSLAEAMTTRLKKGCLAKSDRDTEMSAETLASVPEAVTFETLPPVTVEATLNSAGVQLNYRVLRKQKTQKVQSEQAPVKLNQAPAESKEAPIQSQLDFIKQSIVLVDNDDSLHTSYKYTCKYCLKLSVTNFTLYDHIRFTHQDVPGYLEYAREVQRKEGIRCEYCQKETIFYSQDGLRTHTNFHHPDKVKGRSNKVDKRTCPTCKKVFSQVKALRKHIERIHVGVQYLCDKCPGIFKSEEALENHMKGKHDNIRNYTCHICGASYVTPSYLRKHVKLVHKKEKNKKKEASDQGMSCASKVKKCILCGHRFDQANLKKHMRQIHGVDFEKLKRCSDCSLTFNTRAELEYHRHTAHEVEYNLSCPYCGASYVLKSNFNEHILTFHFSLNVHQCYICKQAHNKGYKLTEHMLQEHPGLKAQDEDHQLSCSHCLEKFSTHKSLVDHVLSPVHHIVFPHNCLTCPQRFMHEHDLEHHIKVVHGMNEDVDFEIRCNSIEDKMVQMVVKCEVKSIDDLPAKAQLALKRLYSQGKTVMIVSKQAQKKKSTTEKKNVEKSEPQMAEKNVSNRDPKLSLMNRAELNSNHSKSQEQDVDCEKDNVTLGVNLTPPLCQSSVFQTSNPQMAVSKSIYPEASSLSIPQGVHHAKPLQQSNEVLRVYRLAVQSEEVARAFQTLNPHQGRQLQSEVVEEQVLSVDDEFVVAEQIGRLDESGNIIEDRVVYVDYDPVPQEMLLNMLPETYMQ